MRKISLHTPFILCFSILLRLLPGGLALQAAQSSHRHVFSCAHDLTGNMKKRRRSDACFSKMETTPEAEIIAADIEPETDLLFGKVKKHITAILFSFTNRLAIYTSHNPFTIHFVHPGIIISNSVLRL